MVLIWLNISCYLRQRRKFYWNLELPNGQQECPILGNIIRSLVISLWLNRRKEGDWMENTAVMKTQKECVATIYAKLWFEQRYDLPTRQAVCKCSMCDMRAHFTVHYTINRLSKKKTAKISIIKELQIHFYTKVSQHLNGLTMKANSRETCPKKNIEKTEFQPSLLTLDISNGVQVDKC